MELIPAIDLRGGRVVRLVEGDFARETAYDADPLAAARRWMGEGARRLHVVDLDGARDGRRAQADLIARIVAEAAFSGVPCQVAGGLRDAGLVAAALDGGADRVVLGTALLHDAGLAAQLVAAHGDRRIVAALDVRDGRAVGQAWQVGAGGTPVKRALDRMSAAGITIFAVTAIDRDGRLDGPDLDLYEGVRRAVPDATLIASGGVSTIDDLVRLRDLGCDGAILGRALYDGRLRLAEALAIVGPR